MSSRSAIPRFPALPPASPGSFSSAVPAFRDALRLRCLGQFISRQLQVCCRSSLVLLLFVSASRLQATWLCIGWTLASLRSSCRCWHVTCPWWCNVVTVVRSFHKEIRLQLIFLFQFCFPELPFSLIRLFGQRRHGASREIRIRLRSFPVCCRQRVSSWLNAHRFRIHLLRDGSLSRSSSR